MAIICVTDDPLMRDFYHWNLMGHWDGGFNPVDEGFEWNVAGGEINNISIGYPKRTFWYELGNNPDYLSSRKIYYYRAWHTYYDGEELIKIYGEMKQFTAINPNCTGFTNFQAKKMINKYYSYHGGRMACKIQPNPGTFICEPVSVPILNFWEILYDVDIPASKIWHIMYFMEDFIESKEPDNCYAIGKRFYYVRVALTRNPHLYLPSYVKYQDGENCVMKNSPTFTETYNADFDLVTFHGQYYLLSFYQCDPPSHVTVWRSTTGEHPDYIP